MHKHSGTANWQSSFLHHFAVYKKKNLGCNFLILFAWKWSLAHPYFTFYMKINHFDIAFIWLEKNGCTFVVLQVCFFQESHIIRGPLFFRSRVRDQTRFLKRCPSFSFVLSLFHKSDQISESKHLNRSKANSHFFRGG